MASAAIFSSIRRRRSASIGAFLSPVDLTNIPLLQTLVAISSELISSFTFKKLPFQRNNPLLSLIRKIQVLGVFLEFIRDLGLDCNSTANLCFKEMYLLLFRAKILLDYCFRSSKLWVLIQNHAISGYFHDINQEISTILDVFPLDELNFNDYDDVIQHIELLKLQLKRANFLVDKRDESLRVKLYSFLNEFESGRIPDEVGLYSFFVKNLGICDAKSFRVEIEFLEEQIVTHDGDIEPAKSVLDGFVALIRYCRFLLFGFEDDGVELGIGKKKAARNGLISKEIEKTFVTIPKDFICPVSLDLMRDPVIVSTGQTYDRASISRWIEEGHCTCPKTGNVLVHTQLVPNRALRHLIMLWCNAHGIPYDPPESSMSSCKTFPDASTCKSVVEANKATTGLLIKQLANGSQSAKAIAARGIRLLAKTGRENRAFIAEAGAIPLLKELLSSPNAVAQENSVTAMLNLSIYEKNKSQVMDEKGCLGSIVGVLRFGHTTEGRENAAATLFSLSAVHDYKKRIAEENGAVEALAWLLTEGTPRGKKDAVTALFNLSTHTDNCMRMIESGAVTALVGALGYEGIAEEAAGALTLIVRQPVGAEVVGDDEMAMAGLIGMMRSGTPRAKENAVAALLELCRTGGTAATGKLLKAPAFVGLVKTLLFTGTKRARRKAASLARVIQRCENVSLYFGGYALARNSDASRDSRFVLDIAMPMSISVPVL